MRIAVLDGSQGAGKLARYLDRLAGLLRERGHDVKPFALRELDIKYCTGCWSCWWRTPGECAFEDDSERVRGAVVNSDFTLLASPMVMGFVSA
ncbi:MAG: NAD(P)H-dependent oxidoreductase, partial [Planctomycetota bacterium]